MLVYLQMVETKEEQTKLEELYLKYREYMYRVAFSILHDPQDAEDAVHYAFVKLAENIQKISDVACPKTKCYIVTIVENKAIDIYRKKQKHPHVEYVDEIVGVQVEYDTADDLAMCILKLPVRQRRVILLKYSQGYTTKEIAKILGITEGNAQKIEYRAKEKLKTLCEEAGIEW